MNCLVMPLYANNEVFHNNLTKFFDGDYEPSLLESFSIILASIISGLTLGITFVGQFIYPRFIRKDESDSNDEVVSEEEEKDSSNLYATNYMTEFDALESRTLSTEELVDLKLNFENEIIVEKNTDSGGEDIKREIMLTYNNETNSFWYYTDYSTKISYEMLNMVARKFAITYNCKSVYLAAPSLKEEEDVEEDVEEDEEEISGEEEIDESEKCVVIQNEECVKKVDDVALKPKSIFATFKKYNNDPLPTKQTLATKDEKSKKEDGVYEEIKKNQFTYKGKLNEFNAIKKKDENVELIKIDYATFKNEYMKKKI